MFIEPGLRYEVMSMIGDSPNASTGGEVLSDTICTFYTKYACASLPAPGRLSLWIGHILLIWCEFCRFHTEGKTPKLVSVCASAKHTCFRTLNESHPVVLKGIIMLVSVLN